MSVESIFAERRNRLVAAMWDVYEKFDMAFFIAADRNDLRRSEGIRIAALAALTLEQFNDCGTACCMAGLASMIEPELREVIITLPTSYMAENGELTSAVETERIKAVAGFYNVRPEAFFTDMWPDSLEKEYYNWSAGDIQLNKVKVSVEALHHFVIAENE